MIAQGGVGTLCFGGWFRSWNGVGGGKQRASWMGVSHGRGLHGRSLPTHSSNFYSFFFLLDSPFFFKKTTPEFGSETPPDLRAK